VSFCFVFLYCYFTHNLYHTHTHTHTLYRDYDCSDGGVADDIQCLGSADRAASLAKALATIPGFHPAALFASVNASFAAANASLAAYDFTSPADTISQGLTNIKSLNGVPNCISALGSS